MCKSSRSIRNLTKPSFKTEREENITSQVKWQNYTAVACVRVTNGFRYIYILPLTHDPNHTPWYMLHTWVPMVTKEPGL